MADVPPAVPQTAPTRELDVDRPVVGLKLPLSISVAAVLLLGAWTLWMLARRSVNPLYSDSLLSNYFAYHQDLLAASLVLLFLIACPFVPPLRRFRDGPLPVDWKAAAALAAVMFILTYAGTLIVFHGFGLSMDEFMADFDARILRNGGPFAPVAAEWRDLTLALQPIFLLHVPGGEFWSSAYLPGNAAIRALLGSLASPVLGAVSLMLVYGIGRKLKPEDREFSLVALLLLASSGQFLITTMTPYAMTAHLALNLAWLWLILDDRRWSRSAAVAVSFAACGLHQVAFHPLFAAPFLIWLWSDQRKDRAFLYGGALLVSSLFWILYWPIALALSGISSTEGADLGGGFFLTRVSLVLFQAVQSVSLVFTADNLLRLLTWQNPLAILLVSAAWLTVRQQPPIVRAMLGGIALMFLFLLLVMPYQGHGWGYRYFHGYLGNFALLGAFGWSAIRDGGMLQAARLRSIAALSMLISLVLLLPLRGYQAHAFAEPYRQADRLLAQVPADILIIESDGRWYAEDLVRNEPLLKNRPIRLHAENLSFAQAKRLCATRKIQVINASSPALARLRSIVTTKNGAYRLRRLWEAGCMGRPAPVSAVQERVK